MTENSLATWKKIIKNLAEADAYEVKVGIQGEKAAAQHDDESGLTTVEIAAVHEFSGPTDKPPGRPFIRPPLYENEDKWKRRLAETLHDVIEKGGNPRQAYRKIGEELRKAMIDRVKAGIPPPLADSTIDARNRRGGSRSRQHGEDNVPLINTRTMIVAISVDVVKAE